MSFIKIFKSALIALLSIQLFSSIALAESPKYSVDSSNYMQHADKLTDGQMKAFENYADYTELMCIQLLQNADYLMRLEQ